MFTEEELKNAMLLPENRQRMYSEIVNQLCTVLKKYGIFSFDVLKDMTYLDLIKFKGIGPISIGVIYRTCKYLKNKELTHDSNDLNKTNS